MNKYAFGVRAARLLDALQRVVLEAVAGKGHVWRGVNVSVRTLPALGAAAFILAGEGGGGGGGGGAGAADAPPPHALAPVLAHPWLQYTGDISYSLYLAHWPVVVMYPFATGREVDGLLADGVMAVAVAVGLAPLRACRPCMKHAEKNSC